MERSATVRTGRRCSAKWCALTWDTSGTVRYRIPSDNPFAASGAICNTTGRTTAAPQCAEIYAWGFRNPWRWSFDRQTGDLWVGDVGERVSEEVNRVTAGGNYGWRCLEGTHDFNTGRNAGLRHRRSHQILSTEYDHDDGVSVTGGYVYRGTAVHEPGWPLPLRRLRHRAHLGRFRRHAAHDDDDDARSITGFNISSFGEDNDGELYIVNTTAAICTASPFGAAAARPRPRNSPPPAA